MGPPTRPPRARSSDYARAELAIRYLDAHQAEQPSLAEVSAAVGLSEFHFQRLFQRWVGVTPKAFLQLLTLRHARHLLDGSASLLESSLAVGLSGPGRLHDLFVKVERMTPGEAKAGGAGLALRWGQHETPLGEALLATTDRGLCALSFLQGGVEEGLAELRARWPGASWKRQPSATEPYARELGRRLRGLPPRPISVLLKGTDFQLQVWEALLRIPEGAALSYGALAKGVGQEKASRAVGSAVGANPVGYFIPCHRVIRGTGAFGDYRWGLLRKRTLLAWEQLRRERELPATLPGPVHKGS